MTVDNDADITASGEDDVPQTESAWRARRRRLGAACGRGMRRCRTRWRPILLSLLVVAALGWAGELYYYDYRPDQLTDDAVARQVIKAASDGAVALLSYSPDSLGPDVQSAKLRITPEFEATYLRFIEQIVTPASQRGQLTTTVHIIRAAVAELHPNSAVVLLFIGQKLVSKLKPEPVNTTSSVRVELTKVNGAWLINAFDSTHA
ncbi:hypothetical protein [Mycobacterium sp. 1423905.2]|uniref:hypothetical protein n=1 Tax=Mycobacterium sp. 1423905.2 TaxID=1856859 RepID=UPI0008006279|nr:hypothetical protein [Mycobacterium sp. 1423905.2]OBJ56679.1 hypothetical protein A9W95_13130 [Mycobacterium sp. 1423905.2]